MKCLLAVLMLAVLAGCAAPRLRSPEFHVAPGQYAAAFEAARDTLVAARFEIERVDAAGGVITTNAKTTAGLATPWDTEQSTLTQEWEDFVNDQQRRVRITFEPRTPPAGDGPIDLRTVDGPMIGRIEVVVDRIRRPNWRLEPTSMRFSSFAQDPALAGRGMAPRYEVPFTQDPLLAARFAEQIRTRLGEAPAGER